MRRRIRSVLRINRLDIGHFDLPAVGALIDAIGSISSPLYQTRPTVTTELNKPAVVAGVAGDSERTNQTATAREALAVDSRRR